MLGVSLAVATVVAIVFIALYAAATGSDGGGRNGNSGLVTSCSVTFEAPTQEWLAAMHQRLRQRMLSAEVWQTQAGGEAKGVILVLGLDLNYRNDVELEFFQDTSFLYLTGVDEPGYAALIDIASSNTTLLIPVRDSSWAIW